MAAKIYFYYGAMRSSKTAQILMRAHNYKEANIQVLLAKPSEDIRNDNMMWSRVGMQEPCITVEELFELDDSEVKKNKIIIIDEAQFLSKEQVDKLVYYADYLSVIIMCYGLKNDSVGELFEGSKRLLEVADESHQLESTCWCGKPALFDAYVKDGKMLGNPAGNGTAEDDSCFYPLCRKHFFERKWKKGL